MLRKLRKLLWREGPGEEAPSFQGQMISNRFGVPVCWAWQDDINLTSYLLMVEPTNHWLH